VSLENKHPLLISVTYVPGYYRLQRQLCIPSISEAIPKLANICTTTHSVSSAATKYMRVRKHHVFYHFSKSCHHEALRVPVVSLNFAPGCNYRLYNTELGNKQAGFFFFFFGIFCCFLFNMWQVQLAYFGEEESSVPMRKEYSSSRCPRGTCLLPQGTVRKSQC